MATRRRSAALREHRGKMKRTDRQDDIPDCPSIDQTSNRIREESEETNAEIKTEPSETESNISQSFCQFEQIQTPEKIKFPTTKFAQHSQNPQKSQKVRLMSKNFGIVLEGLGGVALEFLLYTMGMFRYTIRYPTPFAIGMIICGIYFMITYLEVSLAAAAELIVGTVWPIAHLVFLTMRRFLKMGSEMFSDADSIGHSIYCDMAASWCLRFNLMCEKQCTFTSQTLERLHQ